MRKTFLVILLSGIFLSALGQQKKAALFLGNSYTYVNDLPKMIADIALSKGDTLTHDDHTPGGYRIMQHASDQTSLTKISAQTWDFVVIQCQSQEPSFPAFQVQSDVFPYAKTLADSIHRSGPCTQTVFFMTWGRKNGDAANCQFYPPLCTYAGMQGELRKNYIQMGVDNDAWVAPVGMAWKYAIDNWPNMELYSQDESHPELLGSYLAACTFYATLFQKSPIGASKPAQITTQEADSLQKAAFLTVFDSLPTWNIQPDTAVASFTVSANFDTVTCTATGSVFDSLFWDFNDGNTSTDVNPTHVYATAGAKRIDLTAKKGCNTASSFEEVLVNKPATFVREFTGPNAQVQLFPNPVNHHLTIKSERVLEKIQVLNAHGQVFLTAQSDLGNRIELDLSELEPGIYFLSLESQGQVAIKEFVKISD